MAVGFDRRVGQALQTRFPMSFCNVCGQLAPASIRVCEACGAELKAISQEASAKPVLTFSETLHHYFAIGNELYEAKARGDNGEMTRMMQELVDSLRTAMMTTLEAHGDADALGRAISDELAVERRTLWLRRAASKLQAAEPGQLSLVLLGSAGIIAVFVLTWNVFSAVGAGLALVALRLMLPGFLDRLAKHEERELRKLRHVDSAELTPRAGDNDSSGLCWIGYWIGYLICWILVFLTCWIYCVAEYGFLLGVGLGWLPSGIVATLASLLWPVGLVILAYVLLAK
jgi:hypothetical protein